MLAVGHHSLRHFSAFYYLQKQSKTIVCIKDGRVPNFFLFFEAQQPHTNLICGAFYKLKLCDFTNLCPRFYFLYFLHKTQNLYLNFFKRHKSKEIFLFIFVI